MRAIAFLLLALASAQPLNSTSATASASATKTTTASSSDTRSSSATRTSTASSSDTRSATSTRSSSVSPSATRSSISTKSSTLSSSVTSFPRVSPFMPSHTPTMSTTFTPSSSYTQTYSSFPTFTATSTTTATPTQTPSSSVTPRSTPSSIPYVALAPFLTYDYLDKTRENLNNIVAAAFFTALTIHAAFSLTIGLLSMAAVMDTIYKLRGGYRGTGYENCEAHCCASPWLVHIGWGIVFPVYGICLALWAFGAIVFSNLILLTYIRMRLACCKPHAPLYDPKGPYEKCSNHKCPHAAPKLPTLFYGSAFLAKKCEHPICPEFLCIHCQEKKLCPKHLVLSARAAAIASDFPPHQPKGPDPYAPV
jgi:hypothetical protein